MTVFKPFLLGLAAVPALLGGSVQAADDKPPVSWVAGSALATSPSTTGSSDHKLSLRPLWAVQYGRYRFSTSRGNELASFGMRSKMPDVYGAGASAVLVQTDQLNLGASLQVDSGRTADDIAQVPGAPSIRPTLRGRIGLGYALGPHWSVNAALSQDLLGRGGGTLINTGVSYTRYWSESTRWSLGAGLGAGSSRYMRTYYGLPETPTRSAFTPAAGLNDLNLGLDIITTLGPRWLAFGGLHLTRLQGDAAASPLTAHNGTWGGSIGLAYRCCP